MKKFYALLVALVLVLSLTSCSKVSQKYADKINEAAEAGEYYDVENQGTINWYYKDASGNLVINT